MDLKIFYNFIVLYRIGTGTVGVLFVLALSLLSPVCSSWTSSACSGTIS